MASYIREMMRQLKSENVTPARSVITTSHCILVHLLVRVIFAVLFSTVPFGVILMLMYAVYISCVSLAQTLNHLVDGFFGFKLSL